MNGKKCLNILKFELCENFLSWTFVRTTLLLPLILGGFSLLSVGIGALLRMNSTPLGVFDEAKVLMYEDGPCSPHSVPEMEERVPEETIASTTGQKHFDKNSINCVTSLEDGKTLLAQKKIDQLLVIPPNISTAVDLHLYRRDTRFSEFDKTFIGLRDILQNQLLDKANLPEPLRNALQGSYNTTKYTVDNSGNATLFTEEQENLEREKKSKSSNLLLQIWGFIIILLSGSIGFQCLKTERTTRLLEVVLTSVTGLEYLVGKITASVTFISVQVGCWIWVSGVALRLISQNGSASSNSDRWLIHLNTEAIWILLFAIVGAVCSQSFGACFGALGKIDDEKNSIRSTTHTIIQQMIIYIPFVAYSDPNSTLSTAFSFIPPFSATVMLVRIGSTDLPPSEIALSFAVLLLVTICAMLFCARVIKGYLAMTGQWWTPIRIWKALTS